MINLKDKYKKIFDSALESHNISVDIKPFPNYCNAKGYYGYIHYYRQGDVNLSLWVREAPTIDEVCEKCVESVHYIIKRKL